MAEAVQSLRQDQRVLLRNVGWETYERLLAEREERRAPRFFYDRGVLEILSPSAEHEEGIDLIATLVRELAAEWEIDMRATGSTTFRREDVARGFEPDASFYFSEKAGRVRGKRDIDLLVDPPPDLVVEVDVTSPSLDKLPIYARVGVPEVWRYAGGRPTIFALHGIVGVVDETGEGEYAEVAESAMLPHLTCEALARFVERGLTMSYPAWVREIRRWAQRVRSGGNRPQQR